jgi:hypothetical protein
VTKEEALGHMKRASSWRTICEVHRELYDMCGVMPEPARTTLRDLVLEAFVMGKKMDAKLREYKADWDDGMYEPNVDHKQDSKARKAA